MNTELVPAVPEAMLNLLVRVTDSMDQLKSDLRLLQDATEESPSLQSWSLDLQSSLITRLSLFKYACKESGITIEKGSGQ